MGSCSRWTWAPGGSATVGGNAATNAGGNRVIRYGMTRDLVLGLGSRIGRRHHRVVHEQYAQEQCGL